MIILIAGKNRIREGFHSSKNEDGQLDMTNEIRYAEGDFRLAADVESELIELDKRLLDARASKTMTARQCDIEVIKAIEPYTKG